MEIGNKLIAEGAPPDTSTYEEDGVGMEDKQPEERNGSFSFYEVLRRANLSE